jgi:hypothetical protein
VNNGIFLIAGFLAEVSGTLKAPDETRGIKKTVCAARLMKEAIQPF